MSTATGSPACRDDEVDPEATAATAAAAPSEESSSLSPASRVLAMADKVADDEDGGEATSEDGSYDSIGPVSRPRRTIDPGDLGGGGSRQRRRGFVQERRGKHKQSALRRPVVESPLESSSESRASSNDSWRQALFGDRRGSSPNSAVGELDGGRDSFGAGPASPAFSGEASLRGSAEIAEQEEEEACREVDEKAVEGMNVKDLKAKAVELGIPTGGRKNQLKARIKQKLSVPNRSSDGGSGSIASAVAADKVDPATAAAGNAVAASAASEDAMVLVTPPTRGASVARSPLEEERVLSGDEPRSRRLEEPNVNVCVAAEISTSPGDPAADSSAQEANSFSDEEYQDARNENTPPPAVRPKTPPTATKQGAAGGEEAPSGRNEAITAEDYSEPIEKSEGCLTSSIESLMEQAPRNGIPAGVSGATTGEAAGNNNRPTTPVLGETAAVFAKGMGDDGGSAHSPIAGVGAGADGCRDVEAGGAGGGGDGGLLPEDAGADGWTSGGSLGNDGRRVAAGGAGQGGVAPDPEEEESGWSDAERQGRQQQQRQVLDGDGSGAGALGSIPVVGSAPPAAASTPPPGSAPAASGRKGRGSEGRAAELGLGVEAGTDGCEADGDLAAPLTPEAPGASIAPVDRVDSVVDGAMKEAHLCALESDDDGGSGPEDDAREGGVSREQRAHEAVDRGAVAERVTGAEGEAETETARRHTREEKEARECAAVEQAGARIPCGVEDKREAVWKRGPEGGHGEQSRRPTQGGDGPVGGERSASRFPEPAEGVIPASRGGELVPVALFSAAVDGEEEEEEEEEEHSSIAKGTTTLGAEEQIEKEQDSVPLVVPSAEVLTQKFLEVALLWDPILRISGPFRDGGGWMDADGGYTNTRLPLLPETEALKAKALVLSAWFHRDASPVARDVPPDVTQKTTRRDTGKAQKSTPPAGQKVRTGESGGETTAVVRKSDFGPADAEGGGARSTMRGQERAATRNSAPRARSVAPSSTRDSRASESGGGTKKAERPGKGRRRSIRRLSVSPPRPRLSTAATASRLSSGSRMSRRSIAPSHRGSLAKAPSRGSVNAAPASADAAAAAAAAAAAPQPARKRNPLIRDLSPPRHSRTSVLRSAGRGSGGREAADVQGVARRQAARRKRGVSVESSTGEGRLKGEAAEVMETPSRTREFRSRKASLAAGHRASTARTGSTNNRGESAKAANSRDPDPYGGGGTPTGTTTPGSGGRSALQVFGFDPTISKLARDDVAMRVAVTPEANARRT